MFAHVRYPFHAVRNAPTLLCPKWPQEPFTEGLSEEAAFCGEPKNAFQQP